MKISIATFLMICLQVAMSPWCLCFGAEVEEEVAPLTCCHAPDGVDPAPCPHCDQEMPIAATAPVKGHFDADPPEWHGFTLFFATGFFEATAVASNDFIEDWAVLDSDPPPLPFQAVHGIFLI